MSECVIQNTQQVNCQILKRKNGAADVLTCTAAFNRGNLPTASFSRLSRCDSGKYKPLDFSLFGTDRFFL